VPAPRKYPNELRERAQRLVAEAMTEDPSLSLNAAVKRIGPRVGIVPDTLRGWCEQARIDAGQEAGTTTADAKRLKELEAGWCRRCAPALQGSALPKWPLSKGCQGAVPGAVPGDARAGYAGPSRQMRTPRRSSPRSQT